MTRDELVEALKRKESAACQELRALLETIASLPGASIVAPPPDVYSHPRELMPELKALMERCEFLRHSARIAGQFPDDPSEQVEVTRAAPDLRVV